MNFDRMLAPWQPAILSLFRFMIGLLLLQYGVAKWLKFPTVPMFANLPTLGQISGALELVLGSLLVIGLFTRPAAFVLSGLMACAYFIGHMFKTGAPVWHPLLNGGTGAAAFCFACLYLSAAGGGPYSVDAIARRKP